MLYVRMLLVMGVSLYTSRIVLAELGVVDFGIYNVVGGIVIMFSFLNGAMSHSTQRYLAFELARENADGLKSIFKASLTIHLLLAVGVLLLAEAIGPILIDRVMNIPPSQLDAAQWVYQCSIAGLILTILQIPFYSAIIARENMQVYAWLGVFDVVAKLGVTFALGCFASGKLKFYALMILGVNIIQYGIYLVYCRRKFPECHLGLNFEKKILVRLGKFASWSTLGTLSWLCRSQGCDIIVNIFFGPVVNAAYAIATKVNVAVNTFVQNFTTAINPGIVKTYSSGEYGEMERLITLGAKFSFFLLLLIVFPILLTTDKILHFWLNDVPGYTTVFTRLILVNSLLESFTGTLYAGVTATGRIKRYQIGAGLLILLNLPLSYLALQAGGSPVSVFIISICLTVVADGIRIGIFKSEFPQFSLRRFFQNFGLPCLKVALIASVIFVINGWWFSNVVWPVIVISGMGMIFLTEFFVGMTSRERNHLRGLLPYVFFRNRSSL